MLLAALALLPLAGLLFFNAQARRREAAAEAENDALRIARVCADNEERMVDSAEQLLTVMSAVPAVKSLDPGACRGLFTRVLGNETEYANLGLLDVSGNVIASAEPVAARADPGRKTFFRMAIDHDQFEASDFDLVRPGCPAEMNCGEPVLGSNGEIDGVLFAELDLDWMTDLGRRLDLPAGMSIAVINPAGMILMRIPDPARWVGTVAPEAPAGLNILQRIGSGTAHQDGSDHVRRLFAFAPLDPGRGLRDFVSAGIPDDLAFAAARASEWRQLEMLAVFALVAFLGAWFAADVLVLRGVRKLLRATQKVTAGDLRTRASPVPGGGEFRELATAFDTMASSIEQQSRERDAAEQELERRVQQRTAELAEANHNLQTEIAERIRAKDELERAAAELRRSNSELEQFAYIASHDLQEPLRMVASYTQLLERRYASQLDATAREFIGYAVDGAKRMQEFITGLLRYSRVGTEPQVLEPVDLEGTLKTTLANLRIAIQESGTQVESRGLPVVKGDPRQLVQLLQNLIANALKFRKPDVLPRIVLWAERDGDFWRVNVHDNGIGLDPKFYERVFVIFQRLHTREEYEGAGLGLAICKKIVERHGGRIWVESREGEGATFSFTLPTQPSQPETQGEPHAS